MLVHAYTYVDAYSHASVNIFVLSCVLPCAYAYVASENQGLGAVHMSRATPANRAHLSHENLYFSTT